MKNLKRTLILGFMISGLAASAFALTADESQVTAPYGGSLPITLSASGGTPPYTFTVESLPIHGSLTGTAPNVTYTPDPTADGLDLFNFTVTDSLGQHVEASKPIKISPPNGTMTATVDGNPVPGNPFTSYGDVSIALSGMGLAEGLHLLSVDVTDVRGGHAFASIHFYVDNTPPTVAWELFPGFPNQPVPCKGTIAMKVFVNDNLSNCPTDDNIASVRLIPPTGPQSNFIRTQDCGHYAILNFDTRTQADGLSTFGANATDRAGNLSATTTYMTIIDNTPPTNVTLTIVPSPVTLNSDPVEHSVISVSASASDATSGMKYLKLYITSGGNDNYLGTFPGSSFSNYQLNTANYGDGTATVRVEAYDQVDNMASTSQTFVIDNAGPTVAITSPANGATGITSLTEVQATAGDPHTISLRKLQIKQGAGSFVDRPMTFTGPDHWTLITPLTTAGTYTIRAYAEDGVGNPGNNDVTVTLSGVNHAPTAYDQPVSLNENTSKAITLTGSDPDSDPLSYIIVAQPTHGTLSGTAPNVTYTPNPNYFGSDTFTFKVNDGSLDSNTATVTLTIAHVNQKPTETNGPVTTNEDTPVGITLTGTDPDSDPLTFTVTTDPTHGTLTGTSPNLTYTPDPLYSGSDSMVVVANDGQLDSDPKTIAITVNHVNHPPVADSQSASTSENTPKALTLTASDADGDTLTYSVVANPTHGNLSGTPPNVTYTPNNDYNGSDSFTFKANDGTADSNVATVSMTITAINQPPTANGQSVSTNEDTTLPITLTGTDPEGASLTYEVTSQPSHGSLSGTPPNVVYAPGPDYNGSDSFAFRVNDGQLYSSPATINITVNAVNDPPVANDQNLSTALNTALPITLTGSDVDGDSLSFGIVTGPTHGSLSGTAPNITFTPNNSYTGSDKIIFSVSDGHGGSAQGIVRISVGGGGTGGNSAPTANAQSVSTNEDTGKDITLTGSDPDSDPLTFLIVENPKHGTLSGAGASRHYEPDANYNGSDSFRFKVNDGLVDSPPATVTITVNAVNDAPVADDQNLKTNYQTALPVTLTGSDVDGDALTFSLVGGAAHGVLSGTPPNVTYTPNAGYSGTDKFNFKANDGTVDSALATINIIVNAQGNNGDNAPTANAQSQSTNEDTPLSLTLTGSDPDNDPLTYIVVRQPLHGTLSGTGANRTYTPSRQYSGADSFIFKVNDGLLDSPVATVSLTVNHVNHKPVADGQSVETPQDTAVLINFTGSDLDGDTLTFIPGTPSHGALTGSGASRTYTPNAGYNGVDSFTLKANDGSVDSDPATIRVLVGNAIGGGNHAPTADAQSLSTNEDTPKSITLTGSDIDGDALTFAVVGNPTNGSLSGTAPNITYTPGLHYHGADSFTFKANDGFVDSALATISLTVNHVNHPPVADDNSVSTLEDTAKPITLTASDVDGDTLSFAIVANPTHGNLTGTPPNVTYTPNLHYHGPDSFTFKANDGTVDGNTATVSVTVVHVNHPPTVFVNPNPVVGNEDTSFGVTLQSTDIDGDTVSYILLTNPANGTLSGSAPNLTYTPNTHFHGTDSFLFKGNDGQDDSAVYTVNLTVNHVNHAPTANTGSTSLAQNNPRSLTLSATDVDGDALTYTIVSGPSHGNVSVGTGATRTYTPNSNYTGADSFTFKANDGAADSNVATFSLTIVAGDNPPVAQDQSVTTAENVAKPITLVATDPDSGQTLTYSIVTNPAHGSLSGTPPNVTYTPNAGYSGADVFTFKANDGTVDSNIGTVSVTVTFVNQPPTASITNPANNSYVHGVVPITILATDDVSVASVDVIIDGGAAQPATLTGLHTYVLNWDTSPTGQASHTIQATAHDGAGLTHSDSVTVIVDRVPPGVSFTPAQGATVVGTVNIPATVTDDRSLSFAEILVDGTQVTSRSNLGGTSALINYSWNTLSLPDGNHTITVHAIDSAGNETSLAHVVGVHNLGGGNPAPDFDIITPANNAYVAGIIKLHGKLTVGTNVSVTYTVDGLNPTAFNPATVNVGQDFTTDPLGLDTTALTDGAHIVEFIATDPTVLQPTRKDITIHVENTPPNVWVDSPTNNATIFMVYNLLARALDPNVVQLDEIRFDINTTPIASIRPGNVDPLNPNYSFLLDTQATDQNNQPVYPDGNYSLTVTAWNKARVPSTPVVVPFHINNANIPTNPAAVFTFNPTDFVWGPTGHDVWCHVTNATIDGTSFNQQGQHALEVKVKMNSSTTWQSWTGPLRLVNNTIYFDRALPPNCRYQLTVRVLDTTGKLLQASVEGIMAIDPSAGASFSTADGTLTFAIPAGALTRPMYFEAQLMTSRPPWMQAADSSFNQVYPSQRSVSGPFQLCGLTSMTSDWVYNEHLTHPASLNHRVNIDALPAAEKTLLRQIQNLLSNNDGANFYWHPLGTSNNQGNVNFRSVDGTTDSLGIYRVTSFAPPGSGITDVFNYPNPFHPDEGPTSITYLLGDNSDVTLVLYDALGNLVLKQTYGAGSLGGQAGLNTIPWDGRNGHGDTVASGAYIGQLLVKDVNGGHFKAIRKIGVVR